MNHKHSTHYLNAIAVCVVSLLAFPLLACLDEGVSPRSIRGDSKYDIETSSSGERSSSSQIFTSSSSEAELSSSSSEQPYSIGYIAADESYKTTSVGKFTWMTENEKTACGHFKSNCTDTLGICYGNDPLNCEKYGRLYTWSEAMALPDSCNNVNCLELVEKNHAQGICLSGFHIASGTEWSSFSSAYGWNGWNYSWEPPNHNLAFHLKSATEWDGSDYIQFNALPGGYADEDGYFKGIGEEVLLWVSESFLNDDVDNIKPVNLESDNEDIYQGSPHPKKARAYVRCLKNN